MIQLVWHIAELDGKMSMDKTRIISNLSPILQDLDIQWYDTKEECLVYLRERQDTTDIVFLVLSGTLVQDFLRTADASILKIVDSIFIISANTDDFQKLLINKNKFVGMYSEEKSLTTSICREVEAFKQSDFTVRYYQDKQKTGQIVSHDTAADFLWLKGLKDSLLRFPKTREAKQQMIDRCKLLYRRDAVELERIRKFEIQYRSCDAALWYTKDSFLYRVINQALRTEDVEELLTFRYFLVDLCSLFRTNRMERNSDSMHTFYRGCVLPKSELEPLLQNVGRFIVINPFFSTSRDCSVAHDFAACRCLGDTDGSRVSVFYQLNVVCKRFQSVPFIDISRVGPIQQEQEVLFDFHTVFRVESVTYDEHEECWMVQLNLNEEIQEQVSLSYKELSTIENNMSSHVALLYNLCRMGDYTKARQYSTSLLHSSHNLSGERRRFLIFHAMACSAEGDSSRALKIYQQALIERTPSRFLYSSLTSVALSCIGIILWSVGEMKLGTKYLIESFRQTRWKLRGINLFGTYHSTLSSLSGMIRCLKDGNIAEFIRLYKAVYTRLDRNHAIRGDVLLLTLIQTAHTNIAEGMYQDATEFLDMAIGEARDVVVSYSSLRFDIHVLYASIYIQTNSLLRARQQLAIALQIAETNKSRSYNSARSVCYALSALILFLEGDQNEEIVHLVSYARAAHVQCTGFVHVKAIALVLRNIWLILQNQHTPLNSSQRCQLLDFMCTCVELFEFDKLMLGKSEDNVYRIFLDYIHEIKSAP